MLTVNFFIEEEYIRQNSGVRIKTLADSLTLRYQSGIQTRDFLVNHQIYDLAPCLNPVIHPPLAHNTFPVF